MNELTIFVLFYDDIIWLNENNNNNPELERGVQTMAIKYGGMVEVSYDHHRVRLN